MKELTMIQNNTVKQLNMGIRTINRILGFTKSTQHSYFLKYSIKDKSICMRQYVSATNKSRLVSYFMSLTAMKLYINGFIAGIESTRQ